MDKKSCVKHDDDNEIEDDRQCMITKVLWHVFQIRPWLLSTGSGRHNDAAHEIRLICAQTITPTSSSLEPPRSPFSRLAPLKVMHFHFVCWITFHFQEFQSAAIGEKIIEGQNVQNYRNICSVICINDLYSKKFVNLSKKDQIMCIYFNLILLNDHCFMKTINGKIFVMSWQHLLRLVIF